MNQLSNCPARPQCKRKFELIWTFVNQTLLQISFLIRAQMTMFSKLPTALFAIQSGGPFFFVTTPPLPDCISVNTGDLRNFNERLSLFPKSNCLSANQILFFPLQRTKIGFFHAAIYDFYRD